MLKRTLLAIVLAFFAGLSAGFAEENTEAHHEEHATGSFNAGDFIFDHVNDTYEWHVTTIGHTHVSISLPIILISETKGLQVFMSSNFHHGHDSYNGFKIALEGSNAGKIVEILPDGTEVRPMDFSITKITAALLFSLIVITLLLIKTAGMYKKSPNKAPRGLQSWLEPLIIFIRDDVAKPSIGEDRYEKFVPFLLTVFFFIFINNLFGLIPFAPFGVNVTGNIAIPLALAVIVFLITTISTNKGYWVHIFNTPGVPWWLKFPLPLMPIVELMGVFTKPIILMIRLSANITAGHIIALGFYSLIFIFGEIATGAGYGASVLSVAFTIFMFMLELLVAFIQAYVFTLLSAMYFGMAKVSDHH